MATSLANLQGLAGALATDLETVAAAVAAAAAASFVARAELEAVAPVLAGAQVAALALAAHLAGASVADVGSWASERRGDLVDRAEKAAADTSAALHPSARAKRRGSE